MRTFFVIWCFGDQRWNWLTRTDSVWVSALSGLMSAPTNNQYIKCISSNHFNLKETDNQKFKNQQLIAYKQITNNESFYASFPIIQSPNKKWMRLDCWYSEEKCYNVGSSNKQKCAKSRDFVLNQVCFWSLCSCRRWEIAPVQVVNEPLREVVKKVPGRTSKKKYTKVFRKCSRDTFSVVNISMNAERNFQEEIHQSFREVFAGHTFILSICCLLSIFQLIFSLVCLFLIVVWNYESIRRLWQMMRRC